jgi:hypothetical protein
VVRGKTEEEMEIRYGRGDKKGMERVQMEAGGRKRNRRKIRKMKREGKAKEDGEPKSQ